jgi:hypothetical protein
MDTHNFITSCIRNAQHATTLDQNKTTTNPVSSQDKEDIKDLSSKHYAHLNDEDETTNSLLDYQSALADSITWHSQSCTPTLASQDSMYISSDDMSSNLDAQMQIKKKHLFLL